jgi:hypothetical protein
LSAKSYVYVWADGVYLQARLEDEAQCILVIIGATPEGKKELLGFVDGARESAHDWRALLLDLKRRGLSMAPKVAVADGALGFWKAIGSRRDCRLRALSNPRQDGDRRRAGSPAPEGIVWWEPARRGVRPLLAQHLSAHARRISRLGIHRKGRSPPQRSWCRGRAG